MNSSSFVRGAVKFALTISTCTGIIAAWCLAPGNAIAATISLPASQDTWTVGQTTNTTNHNGDGLRVHEATGGTSLFIPWLQFDLSQIPANAVIDSAHLEMFLVESTSSNTSDIVIAASTHSNATGTVTFNEATFSHFDYANGGAYDTALAINEANWETDHAGIGDYGLVGAGVLGDSGAPPVLNQFYASATADATELALLQSIYNNGGSFVMQIYAPNVSGTHTRVFEDREGTLTGNSLNGPRLVVNYTVPEPSSIALTIVACLGGLACSARHKRVASVVRRSAE